MSQLLLLGMARLDAAVHHVPSPHRSDGLGGDTVAANRSACDAALCVPVQTAVVDGTLLLLRLVHPLLLLDRDTPTGTAWQCLLLLLSWSCLWRLDQWRRYQLRRLCQCGSAIACKPWADAAAGVAVCRLRAGQELPRVLAVVVLQLRRQQRRAVQCRTR